jgi:alkylhydroperoxidase/carboxymuconolactone decarboxylase family protein YurZ
MSTLKVADPELIEIFDNFAFDEAIHHTRLDTRTRLMAQLAGLIGCQTLRECQVMLGSRLTVGVTPVDAGEILYQAVPYADMGKVFDFIHATNDVLTGRGIRLPLERQATTTPATRTEKGRMVQEQIVARTGLSACARRRPWTSGTSSGSCPPTASATTTPAREPTCRYASYSPSPCWQPSADATPKSGGRQWPASTPTTTGRH